MREAEEGLTLLYQLCVLVSFVSLKISFFLALSSIRNNLTWNFMAQKYLSTYVNKVLNGIETDILFWPLRRSVKKWKFFHLIELFLCCFHFDDIVNQFGVRKIDFFCYWCWRWDERGILRALLSKNIPNWKIIAVILWDEGEIGRISFSK